LAAFCFDRHLKEVAELTRARRRGGGAGGERGGGRERERRAAGEELPAGGARRRRRVGRGGGGGRQRGRLQRRGDAQHVGGRNGSAGAARQWRPAAPTPRRVSHFRSARPAGALVPPERRRAPPSAKLRAMSVPEALRGAAADLARLPTPGERLRRGAALARVLGAELLGSLAMIPYAARAAALHRRLPPPPGAAAAPPARGGGGVTLLRALRYGPAPRQLLDLYLPPGAALDCAELERAVDGGARADLSASAAGGAAPAPAPAPGTGRPVALFVHGGVWSSGAAWHYAPMAARLAEEGVVAAVATYSLYPGAQVGAMAAEVSAALTWALDAAPALGGGATPRVALVGHSAGAHLCALALLARAGVGAGGGGGAAAPTTDARMPALFLGMAGCYDVGEHFEHERARGVETLSTMARACGGAANFAAASPAVALRAGGPRAAAALPPTLLLASRADGVVPARQTAALEAALRAAGGRARSVVYDGAGHGDFVVGWPPAGPLPAIAADVVAALAGRAPCC
jgi:acetyl esterase/lipase